MTFDPTKPYQTRSGLKARILATDVQHPEFPLAGTITRADGTEMVEAWTASGHWIAEDDNSRFDLVNVPERKTHTMYIWAYANGALHATSYPPYGGRDHRVLEVVTEGGKIINITEK